ncbi:LysR family transcriptional regulator [Nesterenkonia sp. HG001]|uniref:LysR family transcriptional regulator n=1 Tax=Nesterenkonia sp. HG001 TaxID=2983207 RepID=UPI002AC66A9B|nr:LysR substrate-binding domain-containing protein [Nesterenkonia sp. HG001]MDZ5077652.1 LysR substrate-binding domain-containing protein [Nesterenkonia sp. HG001]
MIDLTRLRTFRAVLAAGSVHAAAANLGYTPSAVSQQLQALQKDTGLELFIRDGRGLAPTGVARHFAEEADRLLGQAVRLEELAVDLREGRTGSLVISHIASVGVTWMPAVVAAISAEFHDLRLDLRLWEAAQGRDEDVDVEICVAHRDLPDRPGYDVEPLLTEPYVAVVPVGHPLAGRRGAALEELAGWRWVDNDLTRGTCRQILLEACAAAGFTPGFQYETQDYGSAVALVAAGVGITVMPRLSFSSVRADPAQVTAVELSGAALRRTIMVRSRGSLCGSPAVRRVLEMLRGLADDGGVTAPAGDVTLESQSF